MVHTEKTSFAGKCVINGTHVTIKLEAVCGGTLWIRIIYGEIVKGKEKRKDIDIHLPRATALNLSDAIKNEYESQLTLNLLNLVQKMVGYQSGDS